MILCNGRMRILIQLWVQFMDIRVFNRTANCTSLGGLDTMVKERVYLHAAIASKPKLPTLIHGKINSVIMKPMTIKLINLHKHGISIITFWGLSSSIGLSGLNVDVSDGSIKLYFKTYRKQYQQAVQQKMKTSIQVKMKALRKRGIMITN